MSGGLISDYIIMNSFMNTTEKQRSSENNVYKMKHDEIYFYQGSLKCY